MSKVNHHKNSGRSRYFSHPFEIAFSGPSGCGKTTMITRLLKRFSSRFEIGYYKDDPESFVHDLPNAEATLVYESGCKNIIVQDQMQMATLRQGEPSRHQKQSQLLDCDMVFVEGMSDSLMPKIRIVEEGEDVVVGEGVLAWVVPNADMLQGCKTPVFHRDAIEEISAFIVNHFYEKVQARPVYGLVLTGGRSTRMKSDKALLNYQGKPQAIFTAEMLAPLVDQVYVSSREGQWDGSPLESYPRINDQFVDFGPIGGILSAMRTHPDAAWLVVACDLPFLEQETLITLCKNRNAYKMATCFDSQEDGLPEPLCAIYEPKIKTRLFEYLGLGSECPRATLLNTSVKRLDAVSSLENVNDAVAYEKAQQRLRGRVTGH